MIGDADTAGMSMRWRYPAVTLLLGLTAACGHDPADQATSTSTTTTIASAPTSTAVPPATSTSTSVGVIASVTTTPTAALPTGWARCTDRTRGYAVGYPGEWHTLRLAIGDCHFFDPEPISAPAGIDGIATWMVAFPQERPASAYAGPSPVDAFTQRILSSQEVTVGGRRMLRRESQATQDVSLPVGTRFYAYYLDCGAGSVSVSTSSAPGRPESEYAAKKATVDRAVGTLQCLA